jgi:hypothetical protein
MTPPHTDSHATPLRTALEHAERLTATRPDATVYTPAWSAQAAHVGDLTILMLAMRD